MADWGDIFGKGSAAEQLLVWGVLNQIISTAGSPFFTVLAQQVNEKLPEAEISPAELADMVVRNFIALSDGKTRASRSGISADRFQLMVDAAGDSPAPGDLATALRRGIISESGTGAESTSFEQGIAEGRLADKWTSVIRQLATVWPSPADALNALLEGQVSEADGQALYEKFGGDPQYFTLLYNTRGNAPTPDEAAVMANRGIIPWTGTGPDVVSFEQAFLEGPWRNKWESPYRQAAQYLPPPRTVTAMLKDGSLTQDQATHLLMEQGLTADLAAAYVQDAELTATADNKALTLSEVTALYVNRLISASDAKSLIVALNYSDANASLLLSLADLSRSIAAVNTAVSRVQTLYISHKITRDTAVNSLNTLKVPPDQVASIVATWDLEVSVNVKVLTETQIVDAWSAQIITLDEAMTELTNIGYTPFDAWVLLSIKNKGPLPDQPAQGPGAPQGSVIPGET
jgi:hypothetical protein